MFREEVVERRLTPAPVRQNFGAPPMQHHAPTLRGPRGGAQSQLGVRDDPHVEIPGDSWDTEALLTPRTSPERAPTRFTGLVFARRAWSKLARSGAPVYGHRHRFARRLVAHVPIMSFVAAVTIVLWFALRHAHIQVVRAPGAPGPGLEVWRERAERAFSPAPGDLCSRILHDDVHSRSDKLPGPVEVAHEAALLPDEAGMWVRGVGATWAPRLIGSEAARVGLRVTTTRCPSGVAMLMVRQRAELEFTSAQGRVGTHVLQDAVAYCVQRALAERAPGSYAGICQPIPESGVKTVPEAADAQSNWMDSLGRVSKFLGGAE